MERLHQRAPDGFPVGADSLMREAYGPIPVPHEGRFQSPSGYGYTTPTFVHGWVWSTTFGRWAAIVQFPCGWKGQTWPMPAPTIPDGGHVPTLHAAALEAARAFGAGFTDTHLEP